MQQDKQKTYTHYISPANIPKYMQWYLYVRNGFRNFFRKSILVSNHTLTWLRIRPPKSYTSNMLATIRHNDPLLLFENPIKTRFLALFPIPEVEVLETAPEVVKTTTTSFFFIDNRKTFREFLSNVFIQLFFFPPLQHVSSGRTSSMVNEAIEMDALEQGKSLPKKDPIDPSWSSNIDARFYDVDEFKEQMSNPKNVLEQSWKSRILYVSTPYGNVWMYYDAFKEGFAYYCDRMGLNYRLLNAIAMKYVMTYRCVDFFMDETVVSNNLSPFLARLKETDSHDLMKKKKNMKYLLGDVSSGVSNSPFLKNRPAPVDVAQKITKNGMYEVDKPIELYRNKFLYMGKICNANVLQTPAKKSSLQTHLGNSSNATMPIITASSLYEATANSQMNYKSFKESRVKQSM